MGVAEAEMHNLIDPNIVDAIRETGNASRDLPERVKILAEQGLPYDRPADEVIITGCMVLSAMPGVFRSLADILERKGLSYTFLSKEYCCGNYLYRPAIKERNDEALAQCRDLSREFVSENILQARALGARRIVIFCSPCYPIYKHAFPDENIVFYPAAIRDAVGDVRFEGTIDYYAGCYRLHKRLSPVPMDLKSTEEILARIQGLKIHRIAAPQCCFHPEGLSHMIGHVETDMMVHVCTGCYLQAVKHMPGDRGTRVLMLPQFIDSLSPETALRR
jgi:hypothetical protein